MLAVPQPHASTWLCKGQGWWVLAVGTPRCLRALQRSYSWRPTARPSLQQPAMRQSGASHANDTPGEHSPRRGTDSNQRPQDTLHARSPVRRSQHWYPGRRLAVLPCLQTTAASAAKGGCCMNRGEERDAHDHALDLPGQQRGSGAAGADVTGPAGATETPPAGGPDHWKQSEAELPPTTPVGPPDLQQAIHAATVALRNHDPVIGLSDPWAQPARIAVEAAYPLLLHATRDRHDALEVYAAELRGLLERSISGPADCWQCDMPGGYHLVDCPVAA